jgi:hypothetical protein
VTDDSESDIEEKEVPKNVFSPLIDFEPAVVIKKAVESMNPESIVEVYSIQLSETFRLA